MEFLKFNRRVLEYPLRLENRSPMSYSRRSRYSPSLSPYDKRRGRSVSRSLSRSPTRSVSSDAENPGNSLYVTGLSHRVTERDLEDHFAKEGKVTDVHLVLDPWTRESRGFGFISMKSVGDANRCIRSLDHSVLQGRVITVEKLFACFHFQVSVAAGLLFVAAVLHQIANVATARRRRGRTPTPGKYLGLRTARGRHKSPSYSPRRSVSCSRSRSRSYSSDRSRSYSPSYGRRGRSSPYSPFYRRGRFYSPSRSPSPDDHYSPYYRRRDRSRSYSRNCRVRDRSPYYMRRYRSRSRSYSPRYRARDRSYSPYYRGRDRSYSPESRYYRRYRSVSGSVSPGGRSMSRSISPRKGRKERRSKSRRHDRQSSMCHSRSARSSTSRSVSP
ncbi:Serine/arginine-rich splicing factor SR45a [Arabidopsis thaliana]